MGVDGLWNWIGYQRGGVIGRSSLAKLAEAAFLTNSNSFQGYRLAIDFSMLLIPIERSAKLLRKENSWILERIFYLILELSSIPFLLPIFVFDGPSRPAQKRNHSIHRGENKLNFQIQEMLNSLGVAFELAEGEAEFYCGRMVDWNRADAVLTGDSDIFLATSGTIIRLPVPVFDPSTDFLTTTFSVYDPIPSQPSRIDFIAIALVVGGDYATGIFVPPTPPRKYHLTSTRDIQLDLAFQLAQSIYSSTKSSLTFSQVLYNTLLSSPNDLSDWGGEAFKLLEALSINLKVKPLSDRSWPSLEVLKLYCNPIIESVPSSMMDSATPNENFDRPIDITKIVRQLRMLGLMEEAIVEYFVKESGIFDAILWAEIRIQAMQNERIGFSKKSTITAGFELKVLEINREQETRVVTFDISALAVELERRTKVGRGTVSRMRSIRMGVEVRRYSGLKVGQVIKPG